MAKIIVEYDEGDGMMPPTLFSKYEKGKKTCDARSPNKWWCTREKGHKGQHEASSDLYEGMAWARWEEIE